MATADGRFTRFNSLSQKCGIRESVVVNPGGTIEQHPRASKAGLCFANPQSNAVILRPKESQNFSSFSMNWDSFFVECTSETIETSPAQSYELAIVNHTYTESEEKREKVLIYDQSSMPQRLHNKFMHQNQQQHS
jgi:hypothetical protein